MLRRCHSAVIGACRPLAGSRLAALEAIAAQIPPGTVRERFANPTHSVPLAPDCIKACAREAAPTVLRACCSYWRRPKQMNLP